MQLDAVHTLASGAGQRIAVIDTGVAPHPRLAGRLLGGGDYLQGSDGLDDCDGHGTAVAGLLAAAPGPDDTFVGIAPGAELLSIRQSSALLQVPGPAGTLVPAGDTDTLAAAIVRAVRQQATVINISEAACLPAATAARAGRSLQAALSYAAESDVVVVAAAGNAGSGGCANPGDDRQVSLPGWYGEGLLTVGATDPDGTPAPFSVPGPWVDVAAPGTGLRSLAVGRGLTGPDVQGTSFAAPWVAGLAALVRERFPQLTAREVADRITATARRPAGVDPAVGHGVIDPLAALTAEPLRLSPDGLIARPTATLPGAEPAPAGTTTPGGAVGLLGVAVLLGAVAAAAGRLRVSPRRVPGPAPRRPPAPPAPGPVPVRSGAAAGPPPGPGRRG
nr:type VII secretion-associated serine protease mycosin [Pseudonocardia acidicola]